MLEKKGRKQNLIELDVREFNRNQIILLEDRSQEMMKEDGTSMQYIIGIIGRKGTVEHRRYITDLMTKLGYRDAKHGAKAIFANPEKFKNVLGEYWYGYG